MTRNPWTGIAVFLPSLGGGGAERVAIRLSAEFASRGIEVDLVAGTADGIRKLEVPDSVNLVDLGVMRFRYALPTLIRYLRRRRPPVMLSFLTQANLFAIVARLIARYPKRLVVSERLHASAATENPDWSWFRLMPLMIRFLYRYSDVVIAVSQGVADDLVMNIGVPNHLVIAVPNPVPVDEIVEKSKQPVDHPWLDEDQTIPVVLGVGRLAPSKDFSTLIRAISAMDDECRLIIIGEGPEREHLVGMASELGVECDFPGYLTNPYPWMAGCDVVALSSRVEGFPNVLVEALALGKRVVATDCDSGPSEILEGGRYGHLVSVGDPQAMAKALARALEETPDSDRLKRKTRDWTPASVADRYLDLLTSTWRSP